MKKINNSFAHSMWLLALLACLVTPSTIFAYTNINGVVWTWAYEGDTHPASAIPPFSIGTSLGNGTDAAGSFSSDGTNMTIISGHSSVAYAIMPGGGGLLGSTNWDGATASGSTIEARMRVLEDTSVFTGPAGLFIETGPYIYELKIHTDRVDFDGYEYFLDATEFHTYRITVDTGPGQIAKLYVDGGTEAVIRNNNRHGDDVNRLLIGDPSGGNYGGKTEWDYIRWTNDGQYPPLPPATTPTVVSATRGLVAATTITVQFSEALLTSSATAATNYSINHGGPVVSATLSLDRTSVTLKTTGALSGSDSNILTINNVQEATGEFTIADNTQVTVTVPDLTVRVQYNQSGNEFVVLEAEHFNQNIGPAGGSSWIFTNAPPLLMPTDANTNYSGDGVMLAIPEAGVNVGSPAIGSTPAGTPRLDFLAYFTSTGTFYVWARGVGDSAPGPSDNDSVLVGADGALAIRTTGFPLGEGYSWGNATAGSDNGPIVITNVGLHVINVWMREDGFVLDKIILTSDSGFIPAGSGAAESPLLVGSTMTVTRNGATLKLSWTGSGTLQSSVSVAGPYENVQGASSPYDVSPTGPQKFYRIRQDF